ncbi:hypothetical protein V8D89_015163 [Ganoderma adspersum]
MPIITTQLAYSLTRRDPHVALDDFMSTMKPKRTSTGRRVAPCIDEMSPRGAFRRECDVEVPESALARRKPLTADRTDHEAVRGLVGSQHRHGFKDTQIGIGLNQNAAGRTDGMESSVAQSTRNQTIDRLRVLSRRSGDLLRSRVFLGDARSARTNRTKREATLLSGEGVHHRERAFWLRLDACWTARTTMTRQSCVAGSPQDPREPGNTAQDAHICFLRCIYAPVEWKKANAELREGVLPLRAGVHNRYASKRTPSLPHEHSPHHCHPIRTMSSLPSLALRVIKTTSSLLRIPPARRCPIRV